MSRTFSLPTATPTILSFKGPDAGRYLNGQITQSAENLNDRSLPACVTDAKGRLQFFVDIMQGQDDHELWVSCPKEYADGLHERLERYLIADEVEIHDLTGQWHLTHAASRIAGVGLIRERTGVFGQGFDHWWQAEQPQGISTVSDEEHERLRILAGIPEWGRELEAGMLPPDAGLDHTAISYSKGCYIGQEVLSRMKSAKKTNRRLARFSSAQKVQSDETILLEGKDVGILTSVSFEPTGIPSCVALGYVKKTGFDHTSFRSQSGAMLLIDAWV